YRLWNNALFFPDTCPWCLNPVPHDHLEHFVAKCSVTKDILGSQFKPYIFLHKPYTLSNFKQLIILIFSTYCNLMNTHFEKIPFNLNYINISHQSEIQRFQFQESLT